MSDSSARKCPYPGCSVSIVGPSILCWPHWDRVRRDQQRPLRSAAARVRLQPGQPMHGRLLKSLLLKPMQSIAKSLEARRARKAGEPESKVGRAA